MRYFVISCVLTASAFIVGGCGDGGPARPARAKPAAVSTTRQETATPAAESLAALAELSPADRAAAAKQGVCPVSDEKLGAMGAPVKVVVKGQTVFLCCEHCKAAIEKNPDKYLAKLKEGGEKKGK